MSQKKVWEKEYGPDSHLITKHDKPQNTFLRFLKYYKKNISSEFTGLRALDMGCGTGRNANYLASLGFSVTGIDISDSAIKIAKERAKDKGLKINFFVGDISDKLVNDDATFDVVLDVTSSNSLNEKEREGFLKEIKRVLKKDGYFFTRALSLDGDKNAKNLLKTNPGKEADTYIMPKLGLVERVFSKGDFEKLYSKYFKIEKLIKETGYTRFDGQNYKRNFWIAYLKNKTKEE